MKRSIGMASLVAAGIGASAMWLSNKPNRIKAESLLREWKRKIFPTVFEKSEQLPIHKGGHPHPHDLEDNKMVDEGAMYSVKFYNEKIQ
ncbi:hypothetical protein BIV60_06590 [Bacillus sp. MUM 116]|uniref:hypothetical protein n=1 Tax=Bacillus sp. MUM 116 TaxID=1678002 RepID=UPI0008F5ABB4|nr:hypothetical protein [Bacillus sp. MUM 116]OIK16127.1 hypothetical protein BIV60_06590 [Bacillus sp. MUM 116]